MEAIGIGLALESRRARSLPPPHEEPGAPPLPSGWRGAATFDAETQDDYDAWSGAPADFIVLTTQHDGWTSFDAGVASSIAEFTGDTRPIVWFLPLTVAGTSLAAVAGGSNDANFAAAAEAMLAAAPADHSAIIVRLGREANGTGALPWAAVGVESDHIAAWRRVHGILRSLSNRFMFDWCLDCENQSGFDWQDIYPGDEYVDVLSFASRYVPHFGDGPDALPTNTNPVDAFNLHFSGIVADLAAFAEVREKPIAIGEWGVGLEKPQWVELVAQWIESRDLVYHAASDQGATRISDGSKGLAGHAYLMHFGTDVPVYGAAAIAGAAAGVLGSGGALPTSWGQNLANVTVTVLGTDVVDGVACLRVRVTADTTGDPYTRFAQFVAPVNWPGAGPATQGQHWTMAVAVKLEHVTGPGASLFGAEIHERDSEGGWLTLGATYDAPGLHGAFPLYADHHVHTRILASSNVATVAGVVGVFIDAASLPSSVDVLIAAPVLVREPAIM